MKYASALVGSALIALSQAATAPSTNPRLYWVAQRSGQSVLIVAFGLFRQADPLLGQIQHCRARLRVRGSLGQFQAVPGGTPILLRRTHGDFPFARTPCHLRDPTAVALRPFLPGE